MTHHNEAVEALREALKQIVELEPQPFAFPEDWHEQIAACAECQRYKDHPIQQGICDAHRRPIWDQEKHASFEAKAIGPRARRIARDALAALEQREGERSVRVEDPADSLLTVTVREPIPTPPPSGWTQEAEDALELLVVLVAADDAEKATRCENAIRSALSSLSAPPPSGWTEAEIETLSRALARWNGYDPEGDPNYVNEHVMTDVAYPRGARLWFRYGAQAKYLLKALSSLPAQPQTALPLSAETRDWFGRIELPVRVDTTRSHVGEFMVIYGDPGDEELIATFGLEDDAKALVEIINTAAPALPAHQPQTDRYGAAPVVYTSGVSTEPLDIIRANECEAPEGLATSRFRALWNEIERLRSAPPAPELKGEGDDQA